MYVVCQNAFLGIHGIKQGRIRRLTTLLKQNKSSKDQRGKQKPGNAKSPETILKTVQHINSFPCKQTHYASKVREYLSVKLDISIMHAFKEVYPDEPVNYFFYLKVFHEHFSLSFGRPQVDTCLTCEEMTIKLKSKELNETAKRVLAAEKNVHCRRAKKFYSKKKKELIEQYQKDDSVAIILMDYMQNLLLPQVPIQSAFYLRQLTVNCFCIHNEKTGEATMFLYYDVGGKGPNEVCSFIKMYLDDEQNISKKVKKLCVFLWRPKS